MMQEPEIVHPHVDRMEDLACNPARLAEFERQERLGIGEGPVPPSPAPTQRHTPHAPQLSTAQRRRNQTGQPREGDGRYAEKPQSKWKQHLGSAPAPRTSLKKVSPSARPGTARQPMPRSKGTRAKPLRSKQAMLDRPWHQKIGWGVRRWLRRKKKHVRALFSWRG